MIAEVARGAAELVVATATWWVETDSVDPRDPAVVAAQGATRGLILIILSLPYWCSRSGSYSPARASH